MRISLWLCLSVAALACRSQERGIESPSSPSHPPPPPTHAPSAPAEPEPEATGASSPVPPKTAYHIAAVGDSLTDPRSHGGGYLDYVKQRCPETTIENFAVGGHMVNQIRKRFEKHVLSRPAGTFSHVVVWGGVNDLYSDKTAYRTLAKIQSDLSAIYRQARAAGARVVAIAVSPWGGFSRYYTAYRGENTRQLNSWILGDNPLVDVAIDAYSLLSCGAPERLCGDYQPRYRDGVHLGKLGHERLGKVLYEAAFSDCR